MIKEIKVLYHEKDMEKLDFVGGYGNSVAIDLYTAEDVTIEAGEFKMINLGITIDIPDGYKADIRPRSSTFSKYGLIQTNSFGLIDQTYRGSSDIIKMPVFSILTKEDIAEYFKQFSKNILRSYDKIDKMNEDAWLSFTLNFSTRKTFIPKNTRLCQLELMPIMEEVKLIDGDIENWDTNSRGGFGSTGK